MDSISEELSPGLTVMLADERYGEPGHADSNWAQLMQAGFNGKQANLLPILQAGDSFETTRKRYDEMTGKAFADNQLVIAQMGIGTDGHIAGILPHSSAAHETKLLVAAYEAEPYRRLTMTFPALMHISADYSFVFGEGKQLALRALERDSLDPIEFPSQALEKLPEAYIYNDQIGEPK
jgi:6-phosphogluconolactonase